MIFIKKFSEFQVIYIFDSEITVLEQVDGFLSVVGFIDVEDDSSCVVFKLTFTHFWNTYVTIS